MINIRNSVWETNSSSVHALCWNDTESPNLPIEIDFKINWFGWEFKYYQTTEEKASYFYTAWCCLENRDVANDIIELLAPYEIECTFSNPPILTTWGNSKNYYVDNGGIDHCYELQDWVSYMRSNPDELVNFLCDSNSFIHTGNDNDDRVDNIVQEVEKCKYHYYKGN